MYSVYLKAVVLSCFSFQAMASVFNLQVVNNDNEPLTDVVVYLQPVDDVKLELSQHSIEIGQLDRAFTPYISVIQRGNNVKFQNKDDITHHIYSPVGENKFSFKIKAGDSRSKDNFTQLGEVAMGCNIHDWMSGYLLVVDTPLFGKTDQQGGLSFDVKHQGEYKVTVWHPQLDSEDNQETQQVSIPKDNNSIIKISHEMLEISEQKNEEDFDFLSDY